MLACLGAGFFVTEIKYNFEIEIQAPTYKAYKAFSSHELKSILYRNMDKEKTKVEDFQVGNTTSIFYNNKGKEKYAIEKVVRMDSLRYLETNIESGTNHLVSRLSFTDKNLITKVHVAETLKGKTVIDRSILFFIQKAIKKNKEKQYQLLKQRIESTPDFQFSPEEQK